MGIEPFLVASTVTVIIAQRLARKICTQCMESVEINVETPKLQNSKTPKIKKSESVVTQLAGDVEQAQPLGTLPDDLIKKHFGDKGVIRVYHGRGCDVCHQTGYTGRIGIFEVLEMNDEIRQAVVNRADAATIRNLAIKNGMITMIDDGLRKVAAGATTIEEVLRVVKEE